MKFKESIYIVLKDYQDRQYSGNQSKAAESLGMTQSSWNRWMSVDGGFNPRLDTLCEAMDTLGVIAVRTPSPDSPIKKLQSLVERPHPEPTDQKQFVEFLKAECEKKDAIIRRLLDLLDSPANEKGDADKSRSA